MSQNENVVEETPDQGLTIPPKLSRGPKAKADVVVGTVVDDGGIKVMSPTEYAEYSKANGRHMGRVLGTKTKLTTEELRVLINESYTPEQVKDKHGIDDAELEQVVWRLSTEERLDKPIRFGKPVKGR